MFELPSLPGVGVDASLLLLNEGDCMSHGQTPHLETGRLGMDRSRSGSPLVNIESPRRAIVLHYVDTTIMTILLLE